MELSHIILLLLIGFLVFTIDKKQNNFPVPMVLVLVGIGLSFFAFFAGVEPSEQLIHDWFLPAVLFTAAYQFNINWLKKNAGIIAVIGTIGIIIGVLLLGSSIYLLGLASLTFTGALLIASILTPIDSVSVISIQQEADQDDKVKEVVEGESLASDGTSIVIFGIVSAMFMGHEDFQFSSFLSDFFIKAGGGALIGFLLSWIFMKVLHVVKHHHYQVMLSLILAYSSFQIAEYFHLAGLLAVISAGLTLSWELDRSDPEKEYRRFLDGFWEVIEPAILSLIFLMIGIEFLSHLNLEDVWSILIVFTLTLIIRFIMVTVLTTINPKWRRKFNWAELALLTVSGIKGTVSVALLLSLASGETREIETILSIAFGVVILSIVLQSLAIYPLSKRMSQNS
ncbi:MAG TPA: sodium:proton antiporter [Planococcus sp. (in: firmicutes)]|nr:sodium:proton antiporter [Planococcus sp. (in: firmicutes)]